MMPSSNCWLTVHLEAGLAFGDSWGDTSAFGQPSVGLTRLFVDVGVLFGLNTLVPFHLGPTIGFSADFTDYFYRYQFFAKARGRLWGGEYFTFETALGIVGSINESWDRGSLGLIGEIALTFHGHIGAYVETAVLFNNDGSEFQVMGGIRASLIGWLIILSNLPSDDD